LIFLSLGLQGIQNKTPSLLRERAGVRVKVNCPNPPTKSPPILTFSPEERRDCLWIKRINPVSVIPNVMEK